MAICKATFLSPFLPLPGGICSSIHVNPHLIIDGASLVDSIMSLVDSVMNGTYLATVIDPTLLVSNSTWKNYAI